MRVLVEEWVQSGAFSLALAAEGLAVLLIAWAILYAAWRTLRAGFDPRAPHPWTNVRLDLARSLALALEFLLAADIVRTAVAPTWNDISKLAAIAVIRTALNYFLQRDIEVTRKSEEPGPANRSGAASEPPGLRRAA